MAFSLVRESQLPLGKTPVLRLEFAQVLKAMVVMLILAHHNEFQQQSYQEIQCGGQGYDALDLEQWHLQEECECAQYVEEYSCWGKVNK
jgi:hypothetical protein